MGTILQPVLTPVKGSADITISTIADDPSQYAVFIGLALLEKVPIDREQPAFKMMLARLYNARMSGRKLAATFGVSRSSLQRWGNALKSGDWNKIMQAMAGQGAPLKVTPEIERYVRDRYHELKDSTRNYNQIIREEVARYFNETLSSERIRQIFAAEREKDSKSVEVSKSEFVLISTGSDDTVEQAMESNSCDNEANTPVSADAAKGSRNYSIPPQCITPPMSEHPVSPSPSFYYHAGLLLVSHWLGGLTDQWKERPELIRQWVGQILLGAVNHEQSKALHFSSLEAILGPTIRSINYQRELLGELAAPQATKELLRLNGQLLNLPESQWFYFDPHTSDYTGELKILKGWCGGKHRVEKVINMDFIHDQEGNPCYVQHADSFYDMRDRFFMCAQSFRTILDHPDRSITWVIDRGIYGLETLEKIIDNKKDHIITWEKDYKKGAWNDDQPTQEMKLAKPRNSSKELRIYHFAWQEVPWKRNPKIRKLIVRATNPNGNVIEVSILCSHPSLAAQEIIRAIFNRWLQENDFGYMDRHVGINELTSRAFESYQKIAPELTDRQIESRAFKALKKEKAAFESSLKKLLLKREKQQQKRDKELHRENTSLASIKQLVEQMPVDSSNPSQIKKREQLQKKKANLEKKHEKMVLQHEQTRQELQQQIDAHNKQLTDVESQTVAILREESRLNALIEEQYLRLDTRRKAFMDSLRIIARNLIYKLANEFRPLYDNHRDDHFIIRELIRSAGIINLHDGHLQVQLIPTMQFPPKTREKVEQLLSNISKQIAEFQGQQYMPMHIQLLASKDEEMRVDFIITS